ncbi:hypothetical protein OPIT5_01335 [Opitutaceae bacterium TAV5]|nr:hypothetical protein OPIT5_01335 [Opitutaceae bacterium TAV5]
MKSISPDAIIHNKQAIDLDAPIGTIHGDINRLPGISSTEKLILSAIYQLSDGGEGWCWACDSMIAYMAGLPSKSRAVGCAVCRLRKKGYLTEVPKGRSRKAVTPKRVVFPKDAKHTRLVGARYRPKNADKDSFLSREDAYGVYAIHETTGKNVLRLTYCKNARSAARFESQGETLGMIGYNDNKTPKSPFPPSGTSLRSEPDSGPGTSKSNVAPSAITNLATFPASVPASPANPSLRSASAAGSAGRKSKPFSEKKSSSRLKREGKPCRKAQKDYVAGLEAAFPEVAAAARSAFPADGLGQQEARKLLRTLRRNTVPASDYLFMFKYMRIIPEKFNPGCLMDLLKCAGSAVRNLRKLLSDKYMWLSESISEKLHVRGNRKPKKDLETDVETVLAMTSEDLRNILETSMERYSWLAAAELIRRGAKTLPDSLPIPRMAVSMSHRHDAFAIARKATGVDLESVVKLDSSGLSRMRASLIEWLEGLHAGLHPMTPVKEMAEVLDEVIGLTPESAARHAWEEAVNAPCNALTEELNCEQAAA